MANEENLKPVRSKDEARERGRNGGIASGEARRKKRDAKSAAKMILDLPTNTEGIKKNLQALGITEEDFTNRVALMSRAFALAMTGDIKAMQFLIETAGETPKQKLDEKRFKAEQNPKSSTTNDNMLDAWFDSIPDDGDVTDGK